MKRSSESVQETTTEATTIQPSALLGIMMDTDQWINRLPSRMINEAILGDQTFLHIASQVGRLNVCQALLTRMSPEAIKATTAKGYTALHLAARHGHEEVCEALLAVMSSEGINASTRNGSTALHEALQGEHQAICKILLPKMNPKVIEATDGHNLMPLRSVIRLGYQEIYQEMIAPMSIKKMINLTRADSEVSKAVHQMIEQFVQTISPTADQVINLNSYQLKLLKLAQVLGYQTSQLDNYLAEYYFELIGVCKVIDQGAPIATLTPIYNDYMKEALSYFPREFLLWPSYYEPKLLSNDNHELNIFFTEAGLSGIDSSVISFYIEQFFNF